MAFGLQKDGVYTIYPDEVNPITVYCEMNKGGWTRVMNRIENTNFFDKSWAEYKNGFGDFFLEIIGLDWKT